MNTFFNTSLCYPPIFGRFSVESLVLLWSTPCDGCY